MALHDDPDNEVLESPPITPTKTSPPIKTPGAPKRTYHQKIRTYPFGKAIPAKPRFR